MPHHPIALAGFEFERLTVDYPNLIPLVSDYTPCLSSLIAAFALMRLMPSIVAMKSCEITKLVLLERSAQVRSHLARRCSTLYFELHPAD